LLRFETAVFSTRSGESPSAFNVRKRAKAHEERSRRRPRRDPGLRVVSDAAAAGAGGELGRSSLGLCLCAQVAVQSPSCCKQIGPPGFEALFGQQQAVFRSQ
jgi:hypothetical protein